ncbi:MAG: discoidin domain-containing protein [Ktedonobacteraceae bacterium]|nr:discoidin domain-containing protein [Ktedonobacteraceae bacterium]
MDAHPTGAMRHRKPVQRLIEIFVLLCSMGILAASPLFTHLPTAYAAGSVQINAGGSAAAPFVSDTDFTGGAAGAITTAAIDTSGVSNPAPQAVYQTNHVGPSFTYTIPGLTANAAYTVRLHFAETYWTKAGQRVFNISINSQQTLNNFDIFAAAGGINKAVVKQFSTTATTSGTINILFTSVVNQAQINGIEVSGGTSSTPTPTPTSTSTPTPTPTGTPTTWTPVWSDNFAGSAGSTPSSANWIEDTGTGYPGGPANWSTGEVETMSKSTSNVYLDGNNHLNITALNVNGAWTSGRIETQRSDFAAPAGGMLQVSASIKQPNPTNGVGYWPKFWSLGAGYRSNISSWPAVGESDIMENVNARSEQSATLHCGTAPSGPCNEYDGLTSGLATCPGCQTGYHTYSEIIDRTHSNEQIRWYLDGQQIWVVNESEVGASTWQAAVDHGFFLIFALGIGGAFPNTVCSCTSPTSATSSGGTLSIGSVSVSQTTGTPPPPLTTPPTPTTSSTVAVSGTQGNWKLMVNGSPYQVKGVTFGPPSAASLAYMPDLQAMGVNTIRTWGTDATTQPLLDAASAYGIKVINGFWLNQNADYVNDTNYKTTTLTAIKNAVSMYKNHPGVLMWDVGNEVILTLQNYYSGTQLEAERNAYAQYVDQVAQAIHAIDPNHPVTSTDAWTGAWPYYKANAPHLDLYAVNSYGAACSVKQNWISGGYTVPYIVTESGPAGEWEVPNDANGVPTQETDVQNSQGYATAWNCITGHTGVALGATLFHYGIENDFGGIWFNLIPGRWKRLSDFTVAQLYGGHISTNTPPVISNMTLGQTSVPTNGQLTVNVNVSDPNGDPLRYNVMFSSKYVDANTAFRYATFTQTGPGSFSVTPPNQLGVWKVYVYAYDGQGNVGIETLSFKVVPPSVPGTNVAIGKPTTAFSYQATGTGAPYPPSNATDGNISTRWATDWSDPQWIEVDLGKVTTINHIQLVWESAYGKSYQIQVSNDGTTWTPIYSTTTGSGGVDDFNVSGSGRYVRMYGTQRGTTYGYSLWEFGIYTP